MRLSVRRSSLPLAVVLVLAVLAGAAAGQAAASAPATGHDGGGSRASHALDRAPLPVHLTASGKEGELPTFTGIDGLTYHATPLVVQGQNGVIYIGQDFDAGCAYGGKLRKAMRQLGRLAHTIEKTGRRVVFTVAPNKSAVDKADLPDPLPHGACDASAFALQDQILDSYQNPSYFQLRSKLAAETARGRQRYWKLDTHWNSISTEIYADAVAAHLDPSVAKLQSCRTSPETILIDLAYLGALDQQYETGPGCANTTPVKVRPRPGTTPFDPSVMISGDVEWTTGPARRVWPGKTALVGDSFTYRSLDNLMPLFRRGHFVWLGNIAASTIVKTVAKSDTVVLESVQRFLGASLLSSSKFRKQVKRAMAVHDRKHPRS